MITLHWSTILVIVLASAYVGIFTVLFIQGCHGGDDE
jgi:ABC-type uncharacterized transport system permease subunit